MQHIFLECRRSVIDDFCLINYSYHAFDTFIQLPCLQTFCTVTMPSKLLYSYHAFDTFVQLPCFWHFCTVTMPSTLLYTYHAFDTFMELPCLWHSCRTSREMIPQSYLCTRHLIQMYWHQSSQNWEVQGNLWLHQPSRENPKVSNTIKLWCSC